MNQFMITAETKIFFKKHKYPFVNALNINYLQTLSPATVRGILGITKPTI